MKYTGYFPNNMPILLLYPTPVALVLTLSKQLVNK